MNRKAEGELIVGLIVLIILAAFIFASYFLSQFILNTGSSVDVAYGVEQNAFWTKLYLKDDHKTVYCIDDDTLRQIAQNAAQQKLKVKVYYQEYFIKGGFCNFDKDYSTVVVKNIEVVP